MTNQARFVVFVNGMSIFKSESLFASYILSPLTNLGASNCLIMNLSKTKAAFIRPVDEHTNRSHPSSLSSNKSEFS